MGMRLHGLLRAQVTLAAAAAAALAAATAAALYHVRRAVWAGNGEHVRQVGIGRLRQERRDVYVRVDGRQVGMRLCGVLRSQGALAATAAATRATAASAADDAL